MAEGEVRQAVEDRLREVAFRAFQAGFDASGEGHNGEYIGTRLRKSGRMDELMRLRFEAWMGGGSCAEEEDALWDRWAREDDDA